MLFRVIYALIEKKLFLCLHAQVRWHHTHAAWLLWESMHRSLNFLLKNISYWCLVSLLGWLVLWVRERVCMAACGGACNYVLLFVSETACVCLNHKRKNKMLLAGNWRSHGWSAFSHGGFSDEKRIDTNLHSDRNLRKTGESCSREGMDQDHIE